MMTEMALRRMCADMRISFDEYLKRYPRATGSMALRASPAAPPSPTERGNAAHGAKIDLMIKGMGIKPAEFAAWKVDQIEEGHRRLRCGERLTETQRQLLEANRAAAPAPAAPTVIPTPRPPTLMLNAPVVVDDDAFRARVAVIRQERDREIGALVAQNERRMAASAGRGPTGTMRMDVHGGRSGR